jgi:hypothetical protein
MNLLKEMAVFNFLICSQNTTSWQAQLIWILAKSKVSDH